MCLGVCHSGVRGPCVWVSFRGEGTVCLGVCHSVVRDRLSGCVSLG